jgi:hypothetical protein
MAHKSVLDESEGNGIATQDPWVFVMKELISKDEYIRSLEFQRGNSKVTSTDDAKFKAWGFVIEQISMSPYPTTDMNLRKKTAQTIFDGTYKRLIKSLQK